jgi:dihydrofolate synthase/folylpolyglutamate synthase
MTYSQAIDFLFGIRLHGQKLELATMRELLRRMGNPQDAMRFVHIAGTNGKGSVAAMSHAILTRAGIRTGLYTSPHLVSFRERFQVNGQPIGERDAARLVEWIRPLLDETATYPDCRQPTFFEVVTALALQYFREQSVDVVVWETGMGGRLDATNVVTPLVSIITNVGLDHMQYLGDTIADIAREKAGIIKPGCPVVTAARDPDALGVIRDRCRRLGCSLAEIGTTITARQLDESLHGQTVELTGTDHAYGPLHVSLVGQHQLDNVAATVAALEAAKLGLPAGAIRQGLAEARWPGRFQVVPSDPPVILDGAHNPPAAAALATCLRRHVEGRNIALILGVLADKEYRQVCEQIAPLARSIACVRVHNDRACAPDVLAACCRAIHPAAVVTTHETIQSAYASARRHRPDVIVVTGSLYLVGDAMNALDLPLGKHHVSHQELTLQ